MSDSTDNTNELDSYGVWVKNTKPEGAPEDDLNFTDSLDLPDFEENGELDETDFEDMFKEDDTLNIDDSADDTTLTDDELMNITSGDGIEIAEVTEDSGMIDDDMPPADISFDSLEENSVSDADLSGFDTDFAETDAAEPAENDISVPEVSIEEPQTEDSEEEITTEDFSFDDIADEAAEAPVAEESTETEEVSTDDFGLDSDGSDEEQEISLDDFMDEGFSDESVASGNNGLAADAAPAAGRTEEVSLDDFVDMSEFGVAEEAPKKEEAITDEKPLDMDISFDSSADTIETEENLSVESIPDDDDEDITDSFGENTEETSVSESEVSGSNDIEAEEVDLSDFGIDADAEETPVTQDVEGEKKQEAVVDFDLSVENNNTSAAPVVNEIKSNAAPIEEIEEVLPEEPEAAVSPADSSLLQQIVADLSSLKEEINTLKTNLEEMKAAPAPVAGDSSGIISEEVAIEEEIIPDNKEDTGFFSGDDGDDTIALSTDELSNILNTADFNTEEVTVESTEDEAPAEQTFVTEEAPAEETFAEEPAVEEEVVVEETPAVEEETFVEETPVVEETFVEETPVVEETVVEETVVEETVSEEPVFEEDTETDNIIDNFEAPEGNQEDLTYDFTDENLSEPNIDDIEIDEESLDDDLPDEISIPKDDDILVESSSSDFMDSVQDTTDEREAQQQEQFAEEAITEEPVIEETIVEEPVEEEVVVEETPVEEAPIEDAASDETFSTVDNFFEQDTPAADITEESGFADIEVEEPVEPEVEDETFVPEEEVTPEAPIEEEIAFTPDTIENDFVSHEDDNNDLTDSNIDYLTTEDKESDVPEADENAELKRDIKSVLLYMDQLLENLPEEKIVEFAKSDEFTTYKKLFSELGLS